MTIKLNQFLFCERGASTATPAEDQGLLRIRPSELVNLWMWLIWLKMSLYAVLLRGF